MSARPGLFPEGELVAGRAGQPQPQPPCHVDGGPDALPGVIRVYQERRLARESPAKAVNARSSLPNAST